MKLRDFALLALACLLWGANLPLTRWITADLPPLFAATLRFAGTALLLAGFLRRLPPQPVRTALVGLCLGGLQFALQYAGVARAPASAVAIVAQLSLPFTVLLSVLVLRDRVTAPRAAGTIAAMIGIGLIVYDPTRLGWSAGLLLTAGSALSLAVGAVLMKRLEIGAFQLQAWSAVVSVVPVGTASALLEHRQWQALADVGPPRWAALLYSIVFASIVGQAIYYGVVRRNDLSLVMPLTLMTPIWAILIGVTMLGEVLSPRAVTGAAITFAGLLTIVTPWRRLIRPVAGAAMKRKELPCTSGLSGASVPEHRTSTRGA